LSEGVRDFIDLKKTSLKRFFDVGDIIYTEIVDVRNGSDVQLSMKSPVTRKLKDGILVKITPTKVPRLIGKEGSMITSIKDKTKTVIRVGQNGVVWLSGEDLGKAVDAIKMVDNKSHIYGLTKKVNKLLCD
jgi:exosome complex component RRP4